MARGRERASVDLDRRPSQHAPGVDDRGHAVLHDPGLGRGRLDPLELEPPRLPTFEREDRDGDPARAVPGDERRIATPLDDRSIDLARPVPLHERAVHRPAVHPQNRARHGRALRDREPHDGFDPLARRARELHREVGAHGPRLRRHAHGELSQRELADLPSVGPTEEVPARSVARGCGRGASLLGQGGLLRRRGWRVDAAGIEQDRERDGGQRVPHASKDSRSRARFSGTSGRKRCPVARRRRPTTSPSSS